MTIAFRQATAQRRWETGMGNPLMDIAWRDFINFAAQHDEIVAQFNHETGSSFMLPGSPIELMIDGATGKVEADAKAFVFWVTKWHWGLEYAPEKLRREIELANIDALETEGENHG